MNAFNNEGFTTVSKTAAKRGDACAQYILARSYWDGANGMPVNVTQAIKWYRKAASQGHVNAQFELALLYATDERIELDYRNAFRWFKEAANQGHKEAEACLGDLYADGNGVARDYKQAARWYEKAATQGDSEAQLKLAEMYRDGRGVEADSEKERFWAFQSAINPDQEGPWANVSNDAGDMDRLIDQSSNGRIVGTQYFDQVPGQPPGVGGLCVIVAYQQAIGT